MKKKIIFLLAAVLVLAAGCARKATQVDAPEEQVQPPAQEEAGDKAMMDQEMVLTYTDLEPWEAKELIDTSLNLSVIDVSPHWAQGHLPGAVSYYLGDGSLDQAIPALDKQKEYLVYCHVESVSRAGAQKLIDAGFEKVYRLNGDYPGWVEAGYPIEK